MTTTGVRTVGPLLIFTAPIPDGGRRRLQRAGFYVQGRLRWRDGVALRWRGQLLIVCRHRGRVL